MNYFNPPIILRSKSGNVGALTIHNGKLAIVNTRTGPRIIAPNHTVIERQPVTGYLTRVLLDVWLQFAHPNGDGLNSGGLDALEDVAEVLRCAGLIDENGQPKKTQTLPAGAGMEET